MTESDEKTRGRSLLISLRHSVRSLHSLPRAVPRHEETEGNGVWRDGRGMRVVFI